MSMLELITKASSKSNQLTSDSQYPIVLNPNPILLKLKPQIQKSNNISFINRVEGCAISQSDTEIIELGQKFYNKLKIKVQNPKSFNKVEFITMLNSYLEKNTAKIEISVGIEAKDEGCYSNVLIQKVGFLMGETVLDLVLKACFMFDIWEIVETLIVSGIVNGPCSKKLVCNLIEKRRSDLVCLCVKHVSDLQVFDILSVLKYFLSPPKDAYETMVSVRKEWERQAISAIETAKDDAVLLVMAYDEFTTNELCLHYLIASQNIDDVILSACFGNLNGLEIMSFVRYLKNWLVKYQKFPQACLSSKAYSTNVWKTFKSVPSLEHVTKCFGLVIDEHFSSLVINPEFYEEVKSVELIVNSLASEARVCCTLANLSASLKK